MYSSQTRNASFLKKKIRICVYAKTKPVVISVISLLCLKNLNILIGSSNVNVYKLPLLVINDLQNYAGGAKTISDRKGINPFLGGFFLLAFCFTRLSFFICRFFFTVEMGV